MIFLSKVKLSSKLIFHITALIFILVNFTGCNTLIDKDKVRILEPRGNVPPPYPDPTTNIPDAMNSNSGMIKPVVEEPKIVANTKTRGSSDVIKPVMNLEDIVPIRNTIIEAPVSQKPIVRSVVDKTPKINPVKLKPQALPTVNEVKQLTYSVKKGDSLWKIARMYGITSQELANENGIELSQILKIGLTLKIPPGGKFIPANERPVVKPQKTKKKLGKIERKSVPGSGMYTVVKGDSLWKIARKFGVKVKELKKLNNLKSDRLDIGQVLFLTPIDGKNLKSLPGKPSTAQPENSYSTFNKINSPEQSNAATEVDVAINVPDTAIGKSASKKPSKFKNLPHYIAGGDTLESISEMYGSKVEWILESNPAINSNEDLAIGIEIQVPCPDIE